MFTATDPVIPGELEEDSARQMVPSDPWEAEWEPPEKEELAAKHALARQRERGLARGAPAVRRPESSGTDKRRARKARKAEPDAQQHARSTGSESAAGPNGERLRLVPEDGSSQHRK